MQAPVTGPFSFLKTCQRSRPAATTSASKTAWTGIIVGLPARIYINPFTVDIQVSVNSVDGENHGNTRKKNC
jgi:hypothetical protein